MKKNSIIQQNILKFLLIFRLYDATKLLSVMLLIMMFKNFYVWCLGFYPKILNKYIKLVPNNKAPQCYPPGKQKPLENPIKQEEEWTHPTLTFYFYYSG